MTTVNWDWTKMGNGFFLCPIHTPCNQWSQTNAPYLFPPRPVRPLSDISGDPSQLVSKTRDLYLGMVGWGLGIAQL